jgi:hypothetical protein
VHELGRDQPKTMKELLNLTTRQASGEEAVPFSYRAVGKKPLAVVEGRPLRQPIRAQRGAPRVTRGDQTDTPSDSWSQPAMMRETTTRMLVTPTM